MTKHDLMLNLVELWFMHNDGIEVSKIDGNIIKYILSALAYEDGLDVVYGDEFVCIGDETIYSNFEL